MNNRHGLSTILALLAPLALLVSPAQALSIGQVDDFEDGTTQGWVVGVGGLGSSPNPPVNVGTGGPAGADDAYLQLTATGAGETPGGRLVAINGSQWAGNYTALGLTVITMDVKNFGIADLSLRLFLENPVAGPPTDTAITDAVFLPAGGDWTPISFSIAAGSLTALTGDVGTLLSNVTLIRLFHGTAATFPPEEISAVLGVDNITAVPAPGTLVLLATGAVALLSRARRRQRC